MTDRVPDQRRLDVLIDRCRLEVENGALPSAQIAVHVDGQGSTPSETFGAATPSTRYVLQSTGRSIVAGVLWKLISDGLLDIARPVASYIPEFGTNGKDSVTVEQVVTHVGGFPLAPLGYPAMLDRDERLSRVLEMAADLCARHRTAVPSDVRRVGDRRAVRAAHRSAHPRLPARH